MSRATAVRRRRLLLSVTAGGIATVLLGVLVLPASGVNLRTDLLAEPFQSAATSTGQWQLPAQPSGINSACLTAGSSASATPIPGCALGGSADAAGQGVLRLTDSSATAAGSVFSTTGIPLSKGIDVRFNSYQWNGTGADGISFVLAATDPANPGSPANGGALGEGLGYATAKGVPGVAYGYLGLGLDAYGNFAKTDPTTLNGCNDTAVKTPEAITVRGPGNGTTGYCIQQVHPLGGPTLDKMTDTTRPAPVPVEIAINPSSSSATTATGITVPANSWLVQVTPYSASGTGFDTPQTVTGTLPSAAAFGFPASWLDPVTGLPYLVTFGWAGSTGGRTETHEIAGFAATTLSGPIPAYSLAVTDDQSGQLAVGASGTVSVTPSLGANDGAEAAGVPVTVRTTFPANLTPQAGTFTTNGYSCTTTGATVVCTYTPSSTVLAGSALPAVVIPVTGASAGSGTVTAGVSSRDSNPATASHAVATTTMAAQSSNITFGANETLSVSGLSGNATGSVTFADAAGTLCTATLPAQSCTATRPSVGAHAVTATWQPTSGSPITASTTFQVAKRPATITATATPASSTFGSSVTLSASGLPTSGGTPSTGTIEYRTPGGTVLCTATLPSTSCIPSIALPVGSTGVTAYYSGDAQTLPAQSAAVTVTVARAPAPFTAGPNGATVAHGVPLPLSIAGLPAGATGTVRFTDQSGRVLCTVDVAQASTCMSPDDLAVGTETITATYSGDGSYLPFTAPSIAVTVLQGKTPAFAAHVAAASVSYGTANVLSFTGLPADATGSVVFSDRSGPLCTVADVTVAASCVTSRTLAVGDRTVTATYSGNTSYPSTTAATAFSVTALSTTLAAAVSDSKVAFGTAVRLIAGGLPSGATGTVRFTDEDGTVLCTVRLADGVSCPTASTLPVGTHRVTATYSGDARYQGSSDTVSVGITAARTASTLSVRADVSAIEQGGGVVLTIAGLPSSAAGTVTITQGGTTICRITLPADHCRVHATGWSLGRAGLVARYSGDTRHAVSTATTTVLVQQSTREAQEVTATPRADGRFAVAVPVTDKGKVTIVRGPRHGTVALVDGEWRYTSKDASEQPDSFVYRVLRADGTSKTVTVTVLANRLAETGMAVGGPIAVGGALLGAGLLLLAGLAIARRRRTLRA